MTPYKIPKTGASAEFTERKSVFIGYCRPVANEEEALRFIAEIKVKHQDASHNVYAYRLREGGRSRHSDDGEPSGTAGMPLLDVFVKQEIYDFCCVATRYFGGIMLGAGGLVRAYSHTGAIALEAAGTAWMRPWHSGTVTIGYNLYESAARLLTEHKAVDIEPSFGENVDIDFAAADEDWTAITASLTELTLGKCVLADHGIKWGVK